MLSPPPMGESDSSDFENADNVQQQPLAKSQSAMPLGHTSVKNLSSKFQNGGHCNNGGGGSQNGNSEQTIEEQKRMIENLRVQLTAKERRIQQLEDQVKLLTMPMKTSETY